MFVQHQNPSTLYISNFFIISLLSHGTSNLILHLHLFAIYLPRVCLCFCLILFTIDLFAVPNLRRTSQARGYPCIPTAACSPRDYELTFSIFSSSIFLSPSKETPLYPHNGAQSLPSSRHSFLPFRMRSRREVCRITFFESALLCPEALMIFQRSTSCPPEAPCSSIRGCSRHYLQHEHVLGKTNYCSSILSYYQSVTMCQKVH